jgi:hypothetical protein
MSSTLRASRLLPRLAIQGLGRRPWRAALLALAVAVGGASIFAAAVLRRAIQDSVGTSLDRLGADLMAVPKATTVNLSSALLTVEPTEETISPGDVAALAALPGGRCGRAATPPRAPERRPVARRPRGPDRIRPRPRFHGATVVGRAAGPRVPAGRPDRRGPTARGGWRHRQTLQPRLDRLRATRAHGGRPVRTRLLRLVRDDGRYFRLGEGVLRARTGRGARDRSRLGPAREAEGGSDPGTVPVRRGPAPRRAGRRGQRAEHDRPSGPAPGPGGARSSSPG